MYQYKLLNTINSPKDIKNYDMKELKVLASDIREALFNRLTKHGGHFGPNFGTVELEIALHYVFHSPVDKFVFDVSHQSYTHKILTGRRLGYTDESHFNEDSGYTNPNESEHDFFNVGHTSTSIALASGLAVARDQKGGKENIIAVIGDGSLSGGEAYEALDYVGGELKSNFIVVVNDNQQAIAETHGGIYRNLRDLRVSHGESENNIFKALGFDYVYEEEGNNLEKLIPLFQSVKDIDHPIVVHIKTTKGKGYKIAEENKEQWHWCMPFDRETGKPTISFPNESYESITSKYLVEKTKKDKDVLVITPAMPGSIGLSQEDRKQMGKQYTDVGIAEEESIALASGAAKNGIKPVVVTNATFLQRAYDQMSQDTAVNDNPIAVILNYSAFNGLTDVTHLGIYINALMGNIPNVRVLSPTNKDEYLKMIDYAIDQNTHPTIVLIPGNGVIDDGRIADTDYDEVTYKIERKGKKAAIIALDDFYQRGEDLAKAFKDRYGYTPTLINPRFASDIDTKTLKELERDHSLVVTIEDGILDGGMGEKIASFYGPSDMKVLNYGLHKSFYDQYDPEQLIKELGMDTDSILKDIEQYV